MFVALVPALTPVYTERDHERERGARIGLRRSNLFETVYTKGRTTNEAGNLGLAESRWIASGANF